MTQQYRTLEEREIREKDSVIVHDTTDWQEEREIPWEGTFLEERDGLARVTNHDDDLPPATVDPEDLERVFLSESEAVAYLASRGMQRYTEAWSEGGVVKAFIGDGGLNFSNYGRTFDLDLGEAGPIDMHTFDREVPEWAEVFVNFIARGARDPEESDSWGYDSPTHNTNMDGAELKDEEEMDDMVLEAARVAGIVE